MKVLIIQTPAFNPNDGGVQRITYNLGKYFTNHNYEVFYFSFASSGHIKEEYGKLFFPEKNKKNLDISFFKDVVNKIAPDFIINQMPYERPISKVLLEFSNKGMHTIGCIHNSLFSFKSNVRYILKQVLPKPLGQLFSKNPFYKIALFYHKLKHRYDLLTLLKRHQTLLLYTPSNLDELNYFLSSDEIKSFHIDFMPNPVDIFEDVKPVKKEKIVLHVGRINNMQKRSDLLLDFWENVYKKLPEWKFQIIGHGPYLETLKLDLKKRNLPNVEILGYKKPEEYFKRASVFMMPSAFEGFPNTVIEAQIYGCPVLAYNSYAAINWIVQDNDNAYLVEPFKSDILAEKCIKLAKDESFLAKARESAIENAKQFTLENVGKKWDKLFIYIMSKHNKS